MAITSGADLSIIEGRLTAARAGYIDNLSAGAVAQAGVFTATRAGYLDNLSAGAAALQATAAAIPTTSINRIQSCTIQVVVGQSTGNTTITAVVLAKTIFVRGGNVAVWGAPRNADDDFNVSFTSSTNVQAVTGSAVANALIKVQGWVVEYK